MLSTAVSRDRSTGFSPAHSTRLVTDFHGALLLPAGPTTAHVRALNKLVLSIKTEPCVLKYWPLKGNLRLVGYPDAAYRNNADNSSQRCQIIFLAEERKVSKGGFGSLIDFESHKMNRVVLSTTVSELLSFYNMLWNILVFFFFVACGWISLPRAWLYICGLMLTTWLRLLPQPV